MLNKKDVQTKDSGVKTKKFLSDCIDNLYDEFCLENATVSISRTRFFRCRPEHILPVSFTAKRSCLCIKHQNLALMTNKGLQQNLARADGALDKFYEKHSNEDFLNFVDNLGTNNVTFGIVNGKEQISEWEEKNQCS